MEQAGYSEMARYRHHPDERVETKTKRKMKSILKQQHQQQEENEEEIGKVSSLTRTDNPESNEISNENIDNQNIVLSSYSNNTMNTTDINLKSNSQTIPPPPLPTCHGPEVDDIPRSRNQFNGTISTEEFQNISSHIRGRCSLHDTQRLLTYLRSEYIKFITKSPSLSPPAMSIQQLDQLGYRVCGQTGQCMLKTLHKLGYIELSKKGDMVTLSSIGMQGIVKKKKK